MIRMIMAVSRNGVIGCNNKLPWDNEFPEDMAYFRNMTKDSTIIMGRKTFESIGRPLPKRRNIVVTSRELDFEGMKDIETAVSLREAIKEGDINDPVPVTFIDEGNPNTQSPIDKTNIWIIGGASMYAEGLMYADEIHVTEVPTYVHSEHAWKDEKKELVYLPYISPVLFPEAERVELRDGMFVRILKRNKEAGFSNST